MAAQTAATRKVHLSHSRHETGGVPKLSSVAGAWRGDGLQGNSRTKLHGGCFRGSRGRGVKGLNLRLTLSPNDLQSEDTDVTTWPAMSFTPPPAGRWSRSVNHQATVSSVRPSCSASTSSTSPIPPGCAPTRRPYTPCGSKRLPRGTGVASGPWSSPWPSS